ncbi:MAG: hypothetical protein DWQ07_14200 [Chloroflexi bacterium]|nr:MAG: hypothetical protein DWQ07_14200 [Chloroflexota bacterium]MBL1195765.1 hypothetical protein [Chloroflexota bacterium]NOH13054.1 hypothetical protein [Chloroflexota bacterium]
MQEHWKVNPTKLHLELEAAGIPIDGVDSDGNINFLDSASEAQKEKATKILADHDPRDLAEERRKMYQKAFTLDEFIEAWMEDRFEGRPEKLESLQIRRKAVKGAVK